MSKVVYVMLDHVDANFNILVSKATKFCVIETQNTFNTLCCCHRVSLRKGNILC
jgi:hypothetical protein